MTTADELMAPAYEKIIVTGGGSGIGRAVTLALTALGVEVWIMGRGIEKLEETRALAEPNNGRVMTAVCDIRDLASVRDAFAEAGSEGVPQGLVHAAAEVWPCAAERLSPEIFGEAVSSQLLGAFNVFHTWSRALIRERLGGVLLCYTSAVSDRETAGLSHSSATKAGVEGLIRTWAMELGRFDIRLNAIGPGLFPLDTTLTMRDGFYDLDMFKSNIPLGRFGNVEEIVAPSLFMLSSGARYVTGATLHVDGGLRLRPWFGLTPERLRDTGEDID